MLNIMLSGVGGQGTVLASKLIARCAMERGETAHTAETIGMAQRGGCVVSHVRIGNDCFSPLIPLGQADAIIAFEPAEAVRVLPYLRQGGTVVVSTAAVKPVTDSLSASGYEGDTMIAYLKSLENITVITVDGMHVIEECGAKSLNIALLGAAAQADVIGVSVAEVRRTIESVLSPRFIDANLKALLLGAKSAE